MYPFCCSSWSHILGLIKLTWFFNVCLHTWSSCWLCLKYPLSFFIYSWFVEEHNFNYVFTLLFKMLFYLLPNSWYCLSIFILMPSLVFICVRCSLKEGTLNMELLQFKSRFPREVLLCRVCCWTLLVLPWWRVYYI